MATARGTTGSYYDDYMRSNAMLKHGTDRNAKQLLTDRNAYISFLEVQLERVSAACLSAQSVEKRLAALEAAQATDDQKIASLSKVLRLNQEYVEQTAEQSRSELAAFARKMDAWMEKYSTELQTHEARITELEEHLGRTDTFVETWSCDVRQELETVKTTMDSEVQDLKTLVFAADARLESMQNAQGDTDTHMDVLQQLVTDRLDADLERIRTSLSEKYLAIEENHEELQANVKMFASEIEAAWKADLARIARADDNKWKRLHDRVDRIDQTAVMEIHEVKDFLRKCLDAQHLLSATVVGLQAEVDEKKFVEASSRRSRRTDDLVEDINELRSNQVKLKEALRVVQSCSRETQQTAEAQYDRLVERLDAAEQQFASLAHESLTKAEDMKTKVLIALGEVEQKLRQDADAVAETAVESVRAESKMYITQFLDAVSSLERRLEDLEHESDTVHVTVPRVSRSMAPRGRESERSDSGDSQPHDIAQITDAVTRTLEKQMAMMASAMRTEVAHHSVVEDELRSHIETLEDRIVKNALRAEEQSAILSVRDPKRRLSAAQRDRPGSSSSASSTKPVKRPSSRAPTPAPPSRTPARRKKSQEPSTSKAKADRLKELCLDLVAMEGTLKSKRRHAEK